MSDKDSPRHGSRPTASLQTPAIWTICASRHHHGSPSPRLPGVPIAQAAGDGSAHDLGRFASPRRAMGSFGLRAHTTGGLDLD